MQKTGKPYREIIQFAEEAQIDLVTMGVRGRGVLDLAVFGSTTYRVMQLGPCPVLFERWTLLNASFSSYGSLSSGKPATLTSCASLPKTLLAIIPASANIRNDKRCIVVSLDIPQSDYVRLEVGCF
jgi:AAA+ ATPase superfamily predicted ATPase